MIQVLREWFSVLPIPDCIQSENRLHFTATMVQDWARGEGIKWVFHTLYYPQANGVVKQTNGLIKKHADVSHHNWIHDCHKRNLSLIPVTDTPSLIGNETSLHREERKKKTTPKAAAWNLT